MLKKIGIAVARSSSDFSSWWLFSPEAGVGATYEWTGNDDVGSGRMTITESAAMVERPKPDLPADWAAGGRSTGCYCSGVPRHAA
jgi:hypothetical protein